MATATIEKKELTFEDVEKLLTQPNCPYNRSSIARQMYPTVLPSSAAAKLKNKLDQKNGFRFIDSEKKKLIKIVTKIITV